MNTHVIPSLSDLNQLRCGDTYRVVTTSGTITGEYLGVETTRGAWSVLFKHQCGTDSIPVTYIRSTAVAAL